MLKPEHDYKVQLEPDNKEGSEDLRQFFGVDKAFHYDRAQEALIELYKRFLPSPGDVVTILTSTQSHYVSGCVTEVVPSSARWSRIFEEKTRLVLVIHEWGLTHPHMEWIQQRTRQLGAVLVEDCAYACASYFANWVGRSGDFTLLSLRKFFGSPLGGVLVCNKGFESHGGHELKPEHFFVLPPKEIDQRRWQVWDWYLKEMNRKAVPYTPGECESPAVFLLPCKEEHEFLKNYLRDKAIECGYWYGNRHLVLPCHQYITIEQVKNICNLLRQGLQSGY